MMVVNQLFNQFQEAMLPFLLQKYRTYFKSKRSSEFPPRIQSILEQRDMWSYEVTMYLLFIYCTFCKLYIKTLLKVRNSSV